jgi:hypothetical protein
VSDEFAAVGRSLPQDLREEIEGMSLPDVVSREQWLAARKELLVKEKALTRARDALNAERRMLPMVEIDSPTSSRDPTVRRRCSTSSPGAAS